MAQRSMRYALTLAGCLGLVGCATMPQQFTLYNKEDRWQGHLDALHETISADINGLHYKGFYIVSRGTAVTTTPDYLFGFPPFMNNMVDISMNSARATLVASDGSRLNCTFLFEGQRMLGSCESPTGDKYQLVAGEERLEKK